MRLLGSCGLGPPKAPRMIDVPIRALCVLLGVLGMWPIPSREDSVVASLVWFSAGALVLSAGFFPRGSLVCGVAGWLLTAKMPLLVEINPLWTAAVVPVGVLIAQERWRWALGGAGVTCVVWWILTREGLTDERWSTFGFSLAIASALGLSAAFMERGIQRQIATRQDEAREAERRLVEERSKMVSDVHDTLTHGLTTQGAMLRWVGTRVDAPELQAAVAEGAAVNLALQYELRTMLRAQDERTLEEVEFAEDIRRRCGRLAEIARVCGYSLRCQVGDLPDHADAHVLRDAGCILQELVTNVFRHASGPEAELCVSMDGDSVLHMSTSNGSAKPLASPPASIARRVRIRGGSVDTRFDDGWVTVLVRLPVR